MFRFTIRELLLLTVIVAMGTGWYFSWRASQSDLLAWKHRAESAENWRRIALTFGHLMRDHGWHVYIREDGKGGYSGWGYVPPYGNSRATNDFLNRRKPLAPVNSALVLPGVQDDL